MIKNLAEYRKAIEDAYWWKDINDIPEEAYKIEKEIHEFEQKLTSNIDKEMNTDIKEINDENTAGTDLHPSSCDELIDYINKLKNMSQEEYEIHIAPSVKIRKERWQRFSNAMGKLSRHDQLKVIDMLRKYDSPLCGDDFIEGGILYNQENKG